MESLWRAADAETMAAAYAQAGVGRDLALRVYSTRLLGGDGRLVLHGGGNTSVKTTAADALGEEVEVLHVKGSGWDMASIEPAGLPAVRLEPLRRLATLDALADEAMVNIQRQNLLDSNAPNPSIETLLHAFLPHRYVDHTHATAVLSITDQADGASRAAEVFGEAMGLVPYIMPGFALARAAVTVFERDPAVEGLILLRHGIFTFGDSAEEAYERMIAQVSRAEATIGRGRSRPFAAAALPASLAPVAAVAPVLRGLVATEIATGSNGGDGAYRRLVLDFRGAERVLDYVGGDELRRYSQAGVVTPDHVIRTRSAPLIVPPPDASEMAAFRAGAAAAVEAYREASHACFARNDATLAGSRTELDPMPRVILVPGLGLFGLGASAKDAGVAADIAESAVEAITGAEAIGRFETIGEAEMFEVEYWSLEQAKLGKGVEPPLARRIAVITGAGGGIGAATARAFAAEGCEVAVLDIDRDAAARVADRIGGAALGITCDVTRAEEVRAAFDRVCATFGGVDIVVSNAGAAWQGRMGEVADETLRASFELNFFAHQSVAQAAVAVMRAQGTGGALLFNVSKQALDPGPDFGPYGIPKAATLALVRQYAIDYGAEGIRANAVNADRVRTGIYADGMLEARAEARGLSVAQYLAGANLLKREVRVGDVAQAFVSLAKADRTTAGIFTVDGGNIAAAPR